MIKYCSILLCLCFFSLPAMATDMAEMAHLAYKGKEYRKAGELYEKLYYKEKIDVYLENAQSAYLSHAFNLCNDKEYKKAINCCKKVLLMNPNNKNARELLCDIYYSRGSNYYYEGLKSRALLDFQNSLKYSVLTEQKQRAQKELAKISSNR